MNKKRIGRLYRLIGRRILKVQRNFQIRDILNLVFIQIILEKSHRSDGGFSSRNFHRKNHIQSTVINDGAGRSHNKIFLTVIGGTETFQDFPQVGSSSSPRERIFSPSCS